MDAKTIQKVINGMADKIDNLDVWKLKLNDMDKILLNRIEASEDKIDDLSKYCQDNKDKIIDLNDKVSDRQLKQEQNDWSYDDLKDWALVLNDKTYDLEAKVSCVLVGVDDLETFQKGAEVIFSKLLIKTDDLEAKNYQLRRELDGIYKVLEMDACDIQKLQDKTEGK